MTVSRALSSGFRRDQVAARNGPIRLTQSATAQRLRRLADLTDEGWVELSTLMGPGESYQNSASLAVFKNNVRIAGLVTVYRSSGVLRKTCGFS